VSRPTWDDTFLAHALIAAKRATCTRAKFGAVIVRSNRIIATGYNGAPEGMPHCTDDGCIVENNHCIRCIHAETNAILQAAIIGTSLPGSIMYVTGRPCSRCALNIVQVGIRKVHYLGTQIDYNTDVVANLSETIFKQARVGTLRHVLVSALRPC
jgi:dCMP deaminase